MLNNMFFIAKTPAFLKWLYPSCIWKIPNERNQIFLTFDDGPTDSFTARILALLKAESIKATFFCVGSQIDKNSALFQKIIQADHAIANHTYNHLNGWNTNKQEYLNNTQKCQQLTKTSLFRPPYGKITRKQLKLLKKNYKVIMWDVAGGDFIDRLSSNDIINNVVKNTCSGSIIVLHDNKKFGEKMLASLPEIIKQLKEKGFIFSKIPNDVHAQL